MKLQFKSVLFVSTFSLLSFFSYAQAEIKVIASIKPIHSLVSYVMDGVGTPEILVDGSSSPHSFQLKPSHAKMLQNADIVFWIGEDLETFLETPLDSIATNAKKIAIMELNDIQLLEFREKHIFEDHDEHVEEDGHDEHNHGEFDIHFWLDPEIAKVIVKNIARELSKIDVDNKSIYKANAVKAIEELDALITATKLKINTNASYVVFHDAYQYF